MRSNYRIANIIFTFFAIAAFAAIVLMQKNVYGYDDEVRFSVIDREMYSFPEEIDWQDKTIKFEDDEGREYECVLKDKRLSVYHSDKLVWISDRDFFVQAMFVADIDPKEEKGVSEQRARSKEEIVVLLWKKGRYGMYRPFWVNEDEKGFSQHIFVYNTVNEEVKPRWGSSYMGKEASSMSFSENGILFLNHKGASETAWKWYSFGFEKLEDVKIFAAGDNLIHEPIYVDALNKYNGKFDHIYKKVKSYTRNADISILNLETPLIYDSKKYSTYPCFGTPASNGEAIKKAGFNVVTLSTNHRFDKGATGVSDTLEIIDDCNLLHVGSMDEKPYLLIKRNEMVFAILNYTYGTNGIRPPKGYENGVNYLDNEERIREEIREAKKNANFIIVCPHWGTEYRTTPDSYQIKWRDVFYEEGVDLVLGTHPHVLEPYEMYKTGDSDHEMLVYYSLGNYISANQRQEHNSGGLAFINVALTSSGPVIKSYDLKEIDTMYKSSKY